MKPEAERYAAYLICKERGHKPIPDPFNPFPLPYKECLYCNTHYWNQWMPQEANVPEKPKD